MGVNKHQLEKEDFLEVLTIDNTEVIAVQVSASLEQLEDRHGVPSAVVQVPTVQYTITSLPYIPYCNYSVFTVEIFVC